MRAYCRVDRCAGDRPVLAGCRPMRPTFRFLDSGRSRPGAIDPLLPLEFPGSGRSQSHSITLSARTRMDCGIEMPSALAALLLMTNSKVVALSIGKSR